MPERQLVRRTLGSPALFAVVYTTSRQRSTSRSASWPTTRSALTPFVFLVGGVFFVLAAMTYVEGASLHQERGGSTVFARYAFNELWSFVAGWAILLDYVILIAIAAFTATNYLAAFWAPLGRGRIEAVVAIAIIAAVAAANVMGLTAAPAPAADQLRRRRPRAPGHGRRARPGARLLLLQGAGPDRPRAPRRPGGTWCSR